MNEGDVHPRRAAGAVAPAHGAFAPAGGTMSAATDDAEVKAVPRAGHLGALSISQLVLAEVALLMTAAAATRGLVPGLVTAAVAAVLLLIFFARRHNRWWIEDRMVACAGPILALRAVAPGLSVRDVSAPDGARVGVARDDAGWFSVVALTPTAPVHQEAAPVPLDALVGVLAATEQPGILLQLVTHTVPAPSLDVHPASPAGGSYRQLALSLSPVAVPAHRESYVCVRIDARGLAEALLDHNADPEIAADLVASLGRKVATSLRRIGIACRVLDTSDLIASLARSCDVESGTAGQVREEWTRWHSTRLAHRTFWLKTWPSSASAISALLDWAAAVPAAQTGVALILDPSGEDDVAVRALIRLAARPEDDLEALEHALFNGVARFGGELRPLDGEHGPAAYATAPTGGGAG